MKPSPNYGWGPLRELDDFVSDKKFNSKTAGFYYTSGGLITGFRMCDEK